MSAKSRAYGDPAPPPVAIGSPTRKMINMIQLSERDLLDFHQSLKWFTGTALPDGRILGNPERVNKPDHFLMQVVKEHLHPTKESSLLELGSAEGEWTVFLAPMVKRLVAMEVRPRNVIASLTRLFVHDIHNVEVWLKDVSVAGPDWGKFDILYHVGVLYHLTNPVAHLFSLKGLADQILLDTHYGDDKLSFPAHEIEYAGKRYPGLLYRELGWGDPFSGTAQYSCWLRRDLLLELLNEIGYKDIKVLSDHEAFGMPRITLVARR